MYRTSECVADKDLQHMTPFEILFIIFATAFTLEEYTASKEHGWESEFK